MAGVAAWAIASQFARPPVFVTPTPTLSPTVSPAPTVPPAPARLRQQIKLRPGKPQVFTRTLNQGDSITYEFDGKKGETLSASLENDQVLMTLLAPDGQAIDNRASQVSRWEGTLPIDGTYLATLNPSSGTGSRDFRLLLSLTEPSQPEPEPEPEEPKYRNRSVSLVPGVEQLASGDLDANTIQRYTVSLKSAQSLTARVVEGDATLRFYFPNGEPVPDMVGSEGTVQADADGRYVVEVTRGEPGSYTVALALTAAPRARAGTRAGTRAHAHIHPDLDPDAHSNPDPNAHEHSDRTRTGSNADTHYPATRSGSEPDPRGLSSRGCSPTHS
ncbi:MAG: hypothetical protein HC857_05470 [Synechococcales cyanobacterium RU_4_20]|nr:hypothetical protein [Synechococcales cyanobacterium RU_4_20]